jgi:hypothetical protein
MIFHNVTMEQINSTHVLFSVLRKLGVVGLLTTSTQRTKDTTSILYSFRAHNYHPEYKGKFTMEENLGSYFRSTEDLEKAAKSL